MLKVIIITNLFPNNIETARATYNRSQFRELAKHCDIKVIAPIAWTDRVRYRLNGEQIFCREVIENIEVFHPTYFFTPKILRCLYGIFFFFSIALCFLRVVKKFKAEIIYSTWAYPDAFAAVALSKIVKIPVVTKIHGSDVHSIDGKVRKLFTRWALCNSLKVFSVSQELAEKAMSLGVQSENLVTIYNGVDGEKFSRKDKNIVRKELQLDKEKWILLFVGNLKKVKGCELLAETVKYLCESCPNIHLYIIGQGGLREVIQTQITAFGVSEFVTLLGPMNHGDIAKWMNAADLLVVPSRNEGVPNVILEAMSCGLPVVATKVGGIPEIVKNNITGYLCNEPVSCLLAESIKKSLVMPWCSSKIINIAQSYTWERNAKILVEQLKGIVLNGTKK